MVERSLPHGHSLAELDPPPDALLQWWKDCIAWPPRTASATQPEGPEASGKHAAWHLLSEDIPEGQRNDTLTRIAGWLRPYHPPPVVEALLVAVNDARCKPPLEAKEVQSIVKSVCRYPQTGVNGHPRAVINPWKGQLNG